MFGVNIMHLCYASRLQNMGLEAARQLTSADSGSVLADSYNIPGKDLKVSARVTIVYNCCA